MSRDKAIGKALRDEGNRIDSMVAMLERDRQRIVNDYMQSAPSRGMHIKDFVEFAEHVSNVGAALSTKIDG